MKAFIRHTPFLLYKCLRNTLIIITTLIGLLHHVHSQSISQDFLDAAGNAVSIDKYIGEIIALSLSGTSSYDPLPKGIAILLSTGLANVMPLHSSAGYTDAVHVGDSFLPVKVSITTGALLSIGFFNPEVLENIYQSIDLNFRFTDDIRDNNISIPLIMPYISINLNFDQPNHSFKIIPNDISIKYGYTEPIEDTIINTVSFPFLSLNRYQSTFYGLALNYTLWKSVFHLIRFSVGYSYLTGGIILSADTGEDTPLRIFFSSYRSTSGDSIPLYLNRLQMKFGNEYAIGTVVANFIHYSDFRVLRTYIGLGGILTAQNNTLSLTSFTIHITADGAEKDNFEVNYNDFKEVTVPFFIPQFMLGFQFFHIVDFGVYVTPSAFSTKIGISLNI